ncbi:aspartic-type endopeptidase OPSB [Physcia stellaris]|nr:aspartic-type endopeptidase OPSB [Physcia stellaris]
MGNSNGKPVVFTDQVNLNHFRLLRVVGKGAFGKVRIVERKDTGLTFALKYIRKDEAPAPTDSECTEVTDQSRYLVIDLMNGGDLRFHISRKTFTEEAVRFWMAELACALRYIHGQGIVHRDLKPDNVMLDSDGHVHLADFNVASDFRPDKMLHSKSGTLAYLAPEVYAGTGYISEVDWWSLGVTFYECIYNKRPFSSHGHEKLEKEILKGTPNYPITQPPVSMPCLHAISSLLEKNKRKRIGAAGFETFTQNPFFQVINFDLLEKKRIAPIFIPSSEKTNFDATYDLEELLLEEAPLEARARRQKPRVQLKDDATDKEIRTDELHRMIETLFEPFDYTTMANAGVSAAAALEGAPELNTSSQAKGSIDVQRGDPESPSSRSATPPIGVHSNNSDYYPAVEQPTTSPPRTQMPPTSHPHQQQPQQQQTPTQRGGTRNVSKGGGVQVTLDETGPWTELAKKNSSLPTDAISCTESAKHAKPNGMLGFLSRHKGREKSPKPQESGVLGKEGARVVINSGGR